jgi:predicted aldo/keto reductase-like oxidoreductase
MAQNFRFADFILFHFLKIERWYEDGNFATLETFSRRRKLGKFRKVTLQQHGQNEKF